MSLYTDLRVQGQVLVAAEDVNEIARARRAAKKDNLRVVAWRENAKKMNSSQRRHRPYTVALTAPNSDYIVRPDAQEG